MHAKGGVDRMCGTAYVGLCVPGSAPYYTAQTNLYGHSAYSASRAAFREVRVMTKPKMAGRPS